MYFAGYRCETYNNPADHYLDVMRQHGVVINQGITVISQDVAKFFSKIVALVLKLMVSSTNS